MMALELYSASVKVKGSSRLLQFLRRMSMSTSGLQRVPMAQMEEWMREYPEAFERDYDPASGLHMNGWIVKEGR